MILTKQLRLGDRGEQECWLQSVSRMLLSQFWLSACSVPKAVTSSSICLQQKHRTLDSSVWRRVKSCCRRTRWWWWIVCAVLVSDRSCCGCQNNLAIVFQLDGLSIHERAVHGSIVTSWLLFCVTPQTSFFWESLLLGKSWASQNTGKQGQKASVRRGWEKSTAKGKVMAGLAQKDLWAQECVDLELLHQGWLEKHAGLERKHSLLAHALFFTHLDFIKWFAT